MRRRELVSGNARYVRLPRSIPDGCRNSHGRGELGSTESVALEVRAFLDDVGGGFRRPRSAGARKSANSTGKRLACRRAARWGVSGGGSLGIALSLRFGAAVELGLEVCGRGAAGVSSTTTKMRRTARPIGLSVRPCRRARVDDALMGRSTVVILRNKAVTCLAIRRAGISTPPGRSSASRDANRAWERTKCRPATRRGHHTSEEPGESRELRRRAPRPKPERVRCPPHHAESRTGAALDGSNAEEKYRRRPLAGRDDDSSDAMRGALRPSTRELRHVRCQRHRRGPDRTTTDPGLARSNQGASLPRRRTQAAAARARGTVSQSPAAKMRPSSSGGTTSSCA